MSMLNANTNLDGRGSVRCLITSNLETLPTHIVSSPLASLRLFRSFYFELLTLSNRTGIQYPGATRSTSKVHINIMYIQYTSIDLASHLIYQVSRVMLLQWLFPLLQKHLVSGLGSTLGFFTRVAADLPFHEVSLLALALLETSGFTNHQQLMLLLDFYFRGVKHREYLKDHHIYPRYVIVHHEALAAWRQWLWRNITISFGRSTPTWFKWLLHSDNLSTSSTIELFSLSLQAKKIVGGLIPLDVGTSLKSQFQPSKHLICSATFRKTSLVPQL